MLIQKKKSTSAPESRPGVKYSIPVRGKGFTFTLCQPGSIATTDDLPRFVGQTRSIKQDED